MIRRKRRSSIPAKKLSLGLILKLNKQQTLCQTGTIPIHFLNVFFCDAFPFIFPPPPQRKITPQQWWCFHSLRFHCFWSFFYGKTFPPLMHWCCHYRLLTHDTDTLFVFFRFHRYITVNAVEIGTPFLFGRKKRLLETKRITAFPGILPAEPGESRN